MKRHRVIAFLQILIFVAWSICMLALIYINKQESKINDEYYAAIDSTDAPHAEFMRLIKEFNNNIANKKYEPQDSIINLMRIQRKEFSYWSDSASRVLDKKYNQ